MTSSDPSTVTTHLSASVNRGDLLETIGVATTGLLNTHMEILRLDFAAHHLVLTGPGVSTEIDAACSGQATIQVDAAAIRRFAAVAPQMDPFPIRVDRGRLFLGPTSFNSQATMDIAPSPLLLPIGSDLPGVLAAIRREGELIAIATVGAAAAKAAEDDFEQRIGQAVCELKCYGVTADDLRTLVDSRLKRGTASQKT